MYSRADFYRRRGHDAQHRAGQTSGWFMLAELMDCLNEHDPQAEKKR
jgi:hypothetical protein